MTVDTLAPPQVAEPLAAEASAGASRRTLLVAGGVAAALALGGGGYFLLSGGSDSTPVSSGPLVLPHHAQPAAKKAVKPLVKKPVVKVPVTSRVPLGRDPFKALYLIPTVTAATSSTSTGSSSTPATTTSGGSTTPAGPTQPTSTAPKVYKLVLSRVDDGKTAVFSVGGKTMLARVGSVFGPTSEIKLLSLTESAKGVWTATIQVGDSDPVDAAKGDVLYVR